MEPNRELTKGHASFLIDRVMELRAAHPEPATHKQKYFLKQRGQWRDGMTLDDAKKCIGRIKSEVYA